MTTIAVNARMLLKGRLDGIGNVAYQALKRMCQAHPEVQFVFLFDRTYNQEFIFSDNITPMVIWPPTRHPFLWYIWFQISVKSKIKELKPDLFLSFDGMFPLGAQCKKVSVISDINFKHYPNDLPFWYRKFFNHYFPKYVKDATKIVAVSNFTKEDLIKTYHVDPAKIDIDYHGVDEGYVPATEETRQQTRKKYTNSNDYFICVGSIHPRKNIARLLEAFELFKKESGSKIKIVIVGVVFWGKTEIYQVVNKMKFKNDVIFTGRVDDTELKNLMASSLCLTYISYFEGFGLPLIEAMRSETPIISSNVTAMPEVAGNAALYIDPFKVEDIKDAMLKIYTDEKLRNELVEKGKIQSKKFSWDKYASRLWECIEKTLNSNFSS